MQRVDFLLLGGGLASATAAETLREEGATGSILILSSETEPPYHRPPLSKRVLLGAVADTTVAVMPMERYRNLHVDMMLGTSAVAVDPVAGVVTTDRNGDIAYGKLLIATGATANRLAVPGAALTGIFNLRTLADAQALRQAAAKAKRVAIVGGSFLGMEVASTLLTMGLHVTIIDLDVRLGTKLFAPDVSAWLADKFSQRGVDIRLGAAVASFAGTGAVEAVLLTNGSLIACDLVVLGVGVTPATGFLQGSGIAVADGVLVDTQLQASVPGIYAAGDVASVYDAASGRYRRVEHWDSAIKQGRTAGYNMLGRRRRYDELSYFYSDILDLSFEAMGFSDEADETIARGDLATQSYAEFQLKGDIVRALFTIGRPAQETKAAEALIRYGVKLVANKSRLADPAYALDAIPNQTVLVLQGGGAMGAFECGVVKALEEAGIFPDIVAGVSIGAFNGAIVASNPGCATAALEAFWDELSVTVPDLWRSPFDNAVTSWQTLGFGLPQFFKPRWLQPPWSQESFPSQWTSFYDTSPVKTLLARYVDFAKLKSSPVRLLVSAVNVETAELEVFDSFYQDLTVDHIVASGSLPPGFPWTTIEGHHYWDGGIISNSPLDLVAERCGVAGKRVFAVDLYASKRTLPANLMQVLARRDEISYAERWRQHEHVSNLKRDYGRLVEDLLDELDPARAAIMRQRPRYIQLIGDTADLAVTRIAREMEADEKAGRDFDFSQEALRRSREQGYSKTRSLIVDRAAEDTKAGV